MDESVNTGATNGGAPPILGHTDYSEKVLAKLAESGITREDAIASGITELTPGDVRTLLGAKAAKRLLNGPAFGYWYSDIDGKPTGVFRVRFLDDEFEKTRPKSEQAPKYLTCKNSGCHLYRAQIGGIDYKVFERNHTEKAIFVEGEAKIIAAVKHGIKGWAIGGVTALMPCPELDDLARTGREVDLIFDSDTTAPEKPGILAAFHAAGHNLAGRGAKVRGVIIPPGSDGRKQGLDDLLANPNGKTIFDKLPRLKFGDAETLIELAHRYPIVRRPRVMIYDIVDDQTRDIADFYNRVAARTISRPQAKGGWKEFPAGPEYIKFPGRVEYSELVYEPGEPEIIGEKYNLWRSPGIVPVKGDVTLWHKLLDAIFGEGADAGRARQWFEAWAAYPLKYLGTKLYTAALIWGAQGAGKGLLGRVIGSLYGDGFTELDGAGELSPTFNRKLKHKSFALANEVITGGDKRGRELQYLKTMLTRESLDINIKFQPQYPIRDTINYLLTSNDPCPIYAEDDDRRFFVWHTPLNIPTEFAEDIAFSFGLTGTDKSKPGWGAGRGALLYYLLNEVDLSSFQPRGRALMTEAKQDLQNLSLGRADIEARALMDFANFDTDGAPRTEPGFYDLIVPDIETLHLKEKKGIEWGAVRRSLSKLGAGPLRDSKGEYVQIRGGDTVKGKLDFVNSRVSGSRADHDGRCRPWVLARASQWQGKIDEEIRGALEERYKAVP